ncbi:SHOCT domain-containing protein [Myxococcus sp. MxC21-1]|uniref:SHOCT domain-containing protein n=1 Tax=Myxococcus sp. MxC21-1 TaxID=3041439 RepID=UPI00292F8AAE|nr:DUF3592 domain-containing protein [Myxococcus sp. MxC21-1]WNZ59746.1 SHOCT domain-containing protein [Myxococcus sp. MxC21-1]
MLTAVLTMLPFLLFSLVGLGAAGFFFYSHAQTKRLREHGTDGEATILRMERTSMQINRSYVYDFLLEFEVPGLPTYRRQHRSRAHDWKAFILEPGVRLKVKIDPNDPQRFVVLGPVNQQRPQSIQALVAAATGFTEARTVAPADPVKALKDLQSMLDNELITQDEYARKKAEILSRL